MEEAERLCDRVVVIDRGRIIAADTPEGLAAGVVADQRMSFVPSAPVEPAALQELQDVHTAGWSGDRIVVTGVDTVASSVIIALHERGIAATKLRVDQPNLDDAFIALTRDDAAANGTADHGETTERAPEGVRS
jgi:ABC-2 type transport system ATP-binding protein